MDLIIIGARAMGRETFSYAHESGFGVKGFLDSKADALDGFTGYAPILGAVEDYEILPEDVFVCALGDPLMRQKYVSMVESKGGHFVSIIHPSAYVGQNVRLGVGCVVCPKVVITNDAVLDDHVIVNVGSTINHDNHIGKFSTICPGCHLAGRVRVGRGVFVGTGALIIPDVTVEDNAIVAAGACVTMKKVASNVLIAGVPAVTKGIRR